jgi:hypothetical protein
MFKTLFVPQGFVTLACVIVLGYRHETGEWPPLTDWISPQPAAPALSWDRAETEPLSPAELQALKEEILAQLDRIATEPEAETTESSR